MRRTVLVLIVALAAAGACSSSGGKGPAASTSTTHQMTFEECQASATYGTNGGRYSVEYDNGVCKVQKP